jgi:glycosyltransferase involved in cell wall biosynthesis
LIVPVFNEEAAIGPFLEAAAARIHIPDASLEYVFVNDGSRDATFARLVAAAAARSDIRLVNFSRNFGKEAAMTAGLDYAEGDAVVLLDVDLQDPPELIAQFVEKWRQGYDIAYGVRQSRAGDSAIKRLTAGTFYRWFNRVAETPIPANVGDFRLLDRRVVHALRELPERGRFMKGLFAWVGFPAIAIPFERPARQHGTTKWNYWRLWNFALTGLVSFSTAPLRVWSYVGATLAAAAVAYALYILALAVFVGIAVPGYASLIIVLLFSSALNLLSLGIIGEYVGRLFVEAKRRPIYLVEGIYRNGARAEEPPLQGPR